jgi:predicted metallopeptidase
MYPTAMPYHDPKYVYRFYEYPSYDADKIIGGFYARDNALKVEVVVAHEIAHAIQFFEYKKFSTRCKPHGPKFKQHYKLLRQLFINDRLPEQSALKAEYETVLKPLSITTYKVA